ncbi:MAG: TM2 domain-containing protein [Actinomycetaceae bacterium]|nr:TM2 domain-containing protein [Actinomycetaceae bacterium]MDY5854505.1 TM2 domain-containing protein [Arcanobacterium sp.]
MSENPYLAGGYPTNSNNQPTPPAPAPQSNQSYAAPAYGTQPPAGNGYYGAPNAAYGNPNQFSQPPATGARSRLVAGLLGIFLGGIGIHRFYLGYTSIGIIQIVVSIFTLGIGSLWGFIEGIMILARASSFQNDADGRPLAD